MDGSEVAFEPRLALEAMVLSRECDRREAILVRQGKAPFHVSSVGHEALAVLAQLIGPGDQVFPHYRDKALMLALGTPVRELARLLLGKAASLANGRQMPGHFGDRSRGVWSALSPVAHHLLPACGFAWAMQRQGLPHVAVALTGEASCRQGEFFEAVAFAVERRLPVLFVVEDNGLGISTPTAHLNPLALGMLDGVKVTRADGRDPEALFAVARRVMHGVRGGAGPAILWCELDRLEGHSSFDDQRGYLPEEVIRAKWERDPVAAFAARLGPQSEVETLRQRFADEVYATFQEVLDEPDPSPKAALDGRLAPAGEPPPFRFPEDYAEKRWSLARAVGVALGAIFEHDPKTVLFGEDVDDPKGGVFGLTRGLSTRFPGRVHNSPLAEATIAGVAPGLAGGGIRPILEMQFADFCGPAMSQIVNDLATLRWRSAGAWTCPAVIYAPYGGYVAGAGMWHSQACEAAFCQIPGLRVAVPSSPADAVGLFWAAAHADDPTVILLPKRLFQVSEPVPAEIPAIAFGKAARLRQGDDITVICWGNTVRVVGDALRLPQAASVSAEVFDLRSLVPWDRVAVMDSVARTGRLLVVQEDNVSGGVGQMIVAEICADARTWASLKTPPLILGRPDVHIGFSGAYGDAYLPQPQAVAERIRDMTGAP
ncbi:putative Transketolase central region [Magnetospirillum sp. XM-1]|uniref:alpha-ketoacid dehydrogenase subunit alpha/beta n=1 Tax=Magnetospirillum sp. XM-1 TaxID=1663591 RepID=UPI00073E0E36|nr:alpha-ketoacid dehydrogenase subunit alpha/beta [Magnetospirillum sp. XM-1]CUW39723.1 putative Transketolase central region [Magnetospirillum sp. XM-1]